LQYNDNAPEERAGLLKGEGLVNPFLGAKGRLGTAWRDGGGDVSPRNL